jgi:hypothetical protein
MSGRPGPLIVHMAASWTAAVSDSPSPPKRGIGYAVTPGFYVTGKAPQGI